MKVFVTWFIISLAALGAQAAVGPSPALPPKMSHRGRGTRDSVSTIRSTGNIPGAEQLNQLTKNSSDLYIQNLVKLNNDCLNPMGRREILKLMNRDIALGNVINSLESRLVINETMRRGIVGFTSHSFEMTDDHEAQKASMLERIVEFDRIYNIALKQLLIVRELSFDMAKQWAYSDRGVSEEMLFEYENIRDVLRVSEDFVDTFKHFMRLKKVENGGSKLSNEFKDMVVRFNKNADFITLVYSQCAIHKVLPDLVKMGVTEIVNINQRFRGEISEIANHWLITLGTGGAEGSGYLKRVKKFHGDLATGKKLRKIFPGCMESIFT